MTTNASLTYRCRVLRSLFESVAYKYILTLTYFVILLFIHIIFILTIFNLTDVNYLVCSFNNDVYLCCCQQAFWAKSIRFCLDFAHILLTEQFFQFVKKHVGLILIHGIVIVAVHFSSPPQRLEHLPLLLDAQPLRHRIGQECRLRPREQGLVVLIHVARLLRLDIYLFSFFGFCVNR